MLNVVFNIHILVKSWAMHVAIGSASCTESRRDLHAFSGPLACAMCVILNFALISAD